MLLLGSDLRELARLLPSRLSIGLRMWKRLPLRHPRMVRLVHVLSLLLLLLWLLLLLRRRRHEAARLVLLRGRVEALGRRGRHRGRSLAS